MACLLLSTLGKGHLLYIKNILSAPNQVSLPTLPQCVLLPKRAKGKQRRRPATQENQLLCAAARL